MNTLELRTQIVHRLADISDIYLLEEVNALLNFKSAERVYKCSKEQRCAIFEAQQAIKRGESLNNYEMQQAVEECLSEN